MSTVSPPPYRLLVIARDPLVRAGLAALASQSEHILVVAQVQPDDDLHRTASIYAADAALWDFAGLDEAVEDWLNTFHAESKHSTPIIALVDDPDVANRLWRLGVQAIVRRDTDSTSLSAAFDAAQHGFRVLDAELDSRASTLTPGLDSPPIEPLTPRELEVLQLLAEGLSNKQIGHTLAISEHTVKFHVNAILGKLSVQSRTEAVVQATRAGLIFL